MRAGVMQPYFFPYFGHFSLIAACDAWVIFDVSQFTPRSWMNRNRVLHPKSGCMYVTVPLAGASIHMQTCAARLLAPEAARRSTLGALSHYRRHARHYDAVVTLVDEAFSTGTDSLVELNRRSLAAVCRYLGLPFRPVLASTLGLDWGSVTGPGDWAPLICSGVGATEYLNPIGGAALFDPLAFRRRGIALKFLESEAMRYSTGPFDFVADLSILDVLMWNDADVVRRALFDRARIVEPSGSCRHAGAVTCISPR